MINSQEWVYPLVFPHLTINLAAVKSLLKYIGKVGEYRLEIACLDLEGVLIPEIWIEFAEKVGVEELQATTRDIPDYDVLMKQRLGLLEQHGLGVHEIQEVISTMSPLDGATDFLNWLRERFQVVILSDTFYQFADSFMAKLGYPALLCHNLIIDDSSGKVVDYKLRQADSKRQAVIGFKSMYYRCIAAGDSYNDTAMLDEAHAGILFRAPDNVIAEFPQYPVARNYEEFKQECLNASNCHLSL